MSVLKYWHDLEGHAEGGEWRGVRIPLVGMPDDDTGWITLTKDAGWGAGAVRLRKRNKVVVLDFSVTIGTTSSGGRLTSIPAEHRASVQVSGAAVSNSGGGVPSQCIVESNGDVMIYYPSGPSSVNAVRGNLTWMVD